jgi:hypothetical protein
MEIEKQTIITPSPHEGEISRIANTISPAAKVIVAIAAFIGVSFSVYRTWSKIDSNEQALKDVKEQMTRQYTTHKAEIDAIKATHRLEVDALKKDTDDELDVLEEDIDRVKEKIIYHEGYEQAKKEK